MPTLLTPKPKTPHSRSHDARTASPGYFSLSVDPEQTTVHSGSTRGLKAAYTPASASIRSVAATPPQNFALQSNPEFEAFRRRSEQNGFNLSQASVSQLTSPPLGRQQSRPIPSRTTSRQASSNPKVVMGPPSTHKSVETTHHDDIVKPSKTSKRLLSSDSQALFEDRPRRESPASFIEPDDSIRNGSPPPKQEERHVRLTHPPGNGSASQNLSHHRAETLPERTESAEEGTPNLASSQHILTILEAHEEEVLVLDLRVSTQYARSHLAGALNLCVPTTLLKRPSYNVGKLADTFKDVDQRAKFERWQDCKCIVVYDANSAQMKEAAICVNILKKFASEGWSGDSYIIKGGFADFARKFPTKLDQGGNQAANTPIPNLTLKMDDKALPPVIGGCPMPITQNAANPFFGNIRQNMDLIGGVGQMSIKHPPTMDRQGNHFDIPAWLRTAASEHDRGKEVADKFLRIEKREQKRMQEALSGHVSYGTPGPNAAHKIQIAGIEKGSKNRYNNIWPYEHSRVKLRDVPADGCDYVNANYMSTSLSRKHYIATQGPIPTTFTDFWNMVWQSDVRVIVMLTAEMEGGQVKAHNYWSDRHYGPLKLSFLSEHRASLEISKIKKHIRRPSLGVRRSTTDQAYSKSRHSSSSDTFSSKGSASPGSDAPYVTVRKFTLSHGGHPFERIREITQLHYSNWPDFGAPAHPAHLLGLVEQCAAVRRSNRGSSYKGRRDDGSADEDEEHEPPVVVHCSAGCGRTGTFCTVDTVVDLLKQQRRARVAADKKSSAQREPTPMDIDGGESYDTSMTGSKGNAINGRRGSGGMSDFFTQGKGGSRVEELKPETKDDWLFSDDQDLIEKTVEEFRLQRLSMVQSLRQYCLTYEAVLEWIVDLQEKEDEDEN